MLASLSSRAWAESTAAFPTTAPASASAAPAGAAPPSAGYPAPPPSSSPPPYAGAYPQQGTSSPPAGYPQQGTYPAPPSYGGSGVPPSPPAPPKEPPPVRSISLTFSPLHLLGPIFEGTIELRPVDHLGLAVIGGAGRITPPHTSDSLSVQEVGAQLLWYPLDAFDSLVLGGEFLYAHIAGNLSEYSATGVASGTAIGPLIGYKLITRGGFTLFVHGGAQYVNASGTAKSTSGDTSVSGSDVDSKWIALVNFNLGWSF